MVELHQGSNLYKILLILLILNVFFCTIGNSQLLRNGSLNGDSGQDQSPPYEWMIGQDCTLDNTPNIYANDASGTKNYLPYDPPTFIALRARGINYVGMYQPNTREFLVQNLTQPLEVGECYVLSAYLCTDLNMAVSDLYENNISYPVTVEIWGSDSMCSVNKLLYKSSPISNTDWFKYNYKFYLDNNSYPIIRFQVSWDPKINNGEAYNGILYVDSMDLFNPCKNDTIYHPPIYYMGDSITTLTAATNGDFYYWKPNANLTGNSGNSIKMLWYDTLNTRYTVTVAHYNDCPTIEIFDVKLNCDILYHKNIIDTVYYKYFHKVTLHAYDGGVKYEWTPQTNLSNPNICCPTLTRFDTAYSVKITDRYGCYYYEEFRISALCDSLVPEKSVIVMDTTLIYNNKEIDKNDGIILKPKVGSVNECSWNPLTGLLISDDCQTALAKPVSSRMYSVQVIDSFRCFHYEKFDIKIQQYFPNFITPNGDGHNDCFIVYGLPERTSLKIFDKSGLLVFSTNSYEETNCWKGDDNKGIPVSTGTYWYVLENKEAGFLKKGFVFLKR